MCDMKTAFDAASDVKTPWNPSRTATARVTNPLPEPERCPNCTGKVEIVNNEKIYGRPYGDWPWAYRCICCDSYVGMHPFTNIPLGTLANAATREARKRAKAAFNPLWQGRRMSRKEAYAWLAKALGIQNVGECHIGWFDIATCERVVKVVTARKSK